jgi:tol-pal system protein YbgF
LQTQVDALNTELRRLRSQNEDLLHNMQDAEKRQKEFYADMDASLRHFESIVISTSSASSSPQPAKAVGGGNMPSVSSGTTANGNAIESGAAAENRAYELAYGYVKAGDHRNAISAFQEFLKNYPESKHVPRVHYEVGSSYVELKDYRRALDSHRLLLSKYPSSSDVPDAMLGIAESQSQLKAIGGAKNTLNQIIAKYPGTKIAEQAKKRLDSLK